MNNITVKIFLVLIFTAAVMFCQTEPDTIKTVQNTDSVFVMQKSPWGAVLRSAILPGFGQFYNESYWKIPIIWAFIGYYTSVWINQNNLYHDERKLIAEARANNLNPSTSNRDFYRNQRDEFAVYIGLAYFLNLVDAYVDAHLFDFDVSVDVYTNQPKLNVRLPLN